MSQATIGKIENENTENNEKSVLIIDSHDFDCPLCFQLLYEPITLSCGHTMCRDCTYQAFQYKKHCPICRNHSSIDIMAAPTNVLISKLLEKYSNNRYKIRGSEMNKIKILRKSRHPIFISRIPEYPYCQISLHIYEAKYRVMVNRILNSDSKFIIAYMNNHNISSNNYPHSIGTLCQIKNCTSFLDGRSHIKVIGLKRVKLTNIKLETDSFGLLSAEIDDYLDIDDEEKDNETLLTPQTLSSLSSSSSPSSVSSTNHSNNNNTNDNNNDNNKFDSFLNFLDKLRTNMNENLNFQTRYWLANGNNNGNNNDKDDDEKKELETRHLKESDMMDKLLLSVERFIEHEESNKDAFYKRVGYPPKNIAKFSLWIAGVLPRRLSQSGGTNIEISQLQLQILVSRNVSHRLKLAQNLATLCIQCSQKRSKVQFWIIVCIIGLAILYELLNGS